MRTVPAEPSQVVIIDCDRPRVADEALNAQAIRAIAGELDLAFARDQVVRPIRGHEVAGDRYPDWEALYQANAGRIYRFMFEKVGNRPDAEDLTGEVFLAALRPLRLSVSTGEVQSYLLATARTVLARHWRGTLRRKITALEGAGVPDAGVENRPNGAALRLAQEILAALPERYRRILELRFLRSCSVKEAAAELGVTVGHAKVLQHRALRQAATVAVGMA